MTVRKKLIVIGAVAVACAVGGIVVATSAPASSTGQTINVISENVDFKPVNTDGSDVPGDLFVARYKMWNSAHTRQVGWAYQSCIENLPSNVDFQTEVCDWVFDFTGRGQITSTAVGSGFPNRPIDPDHAITGGTDQFQTVRGEWHRDPTPSRYVHWIFNLA